MVEQNLKSKITHKKTTLGTWIQIPNTFTTEIIAQSGFEWLAVDLEHGLIDLETAFRLIQVIDCCNVVPLVRLHLNDASTIRRVMDAGAGGVIVPMVNTADEAWKAVSAVKYPPNGSRSFGLGRACKYGVCFEDYLRSINSRSIVVIQIEHVDAIANLDKILSVPGIDAIIIGPYDLSGSLGIPGQFDNPKFKRSLDTIVKKVKKSSVALGVHIVHPDGALLQHRIDEGFTFIGYGMDSIFLQEGSSKAVQDLSDCG